MSVSDEASEVISRNEESEKCSEENVTEKQNLELMKKKKSSQEDDILLQPFNYIVAVPGKQVRSKLAKAFNYWMNVPPDKLGLIGEVIEMLHNASLLIDDIQDNSILRRARPVAHSIYGVASTINSANYVYFLGLQKLLTLEHPQATTVFCDQLLELHRGQGMEIHWRDSFQCPTESEYRQMTIRKTGGLFGLAIKLMHLFSSSERDFTKLTDVLGLYFQIRDDYCNLASREYSENKSFCEDLTEGKFSFPIIHAINTRPENPQLMNVIRQRTKDVEVKKYCVALMKEFGSFSYTRDTLDQLDKEARQEVEKLGGNPYLVSLLDDLGNWKQV